MRVLHVIPSLDSRDGGPSFALPQMATSLAHQGIEVHVATTIDSREAVARSIPLGTPIQVNSWTCHYFPRQSSFYKVSFPLRRWLYAHVENFDLVHVHALFSFAPVVACRAARDAGVPYIIRPLGVLNQWGINNRRRRIKALSLRLIERPLLDGAAVIHYTSISEQREAAALKLNASSVVLPLGIDIAPFLQLPPREAFEKKHPEINGRDLILFLSRIDPKKGLECLLQAMERLVKSHPNTLLVVAGSGSDDYTTALRSLALKLGVAENVLWTGFLGPEEKCAAFGASEVFVLPSKSENFGVALLEAMAAGRACVATSGVALGEEAAAAGAIRIADQDAASLASTLADLLDSPGTRVSLGRAARALAASRYSLEALGEGLADLYHGIVR